MKEGCLPTAAAGLRPAAAQGAVAPGILLRWRRIFPGEGRQLAEVRRFLAALLPECPARDDVVSVATELASNAVKFTASGRGGSFCLETTWHPAMVRTAVADGGAPTGPRLVDDLLAEHGRGLLLVRGLSARMGMTGDHRGRVVWADVPWQGQETAAPGAFADSAR